MLNIAPSALPSPARKSQVRLGVWIEVVTIIWMVIEASVALIIGVATRSVSLLGFGPDSLIELIAGGILLWRLLVEQRGGSLERIEQAERRASWVTAMSLFAFAVYTVADSVFAFITPTQPPTGVITILTLLKARLLPGRKRKDQELF
ncbi:MAG: hypothetical protein ACJ8BW_32125 [Ktedonobacteraceae bacterium]